MKAKICGTCQCSKPVSEFYTIKRTGQPLGYRSTCKQCYKAVTAKNLAGWQIKNRSKSRAHCKKWAATHRGEIAAATRLYRAAKKQRVPKWFEHAEVEQIYVEAQRKGLAVDHIVPLQGRTVSGLHCLANLQLLTKSENSAKGNRYES